MTTSHLRNSVNRSPLPRGFLLVALLLICFARSEHAQTFNSTAKMYGTIMDSNASLFREMNTYNAIVSQGRALSSLPASSRAPSNREPPYRPQLARWQFPITATDFRPTTYRIAPVELAHAIPGLTGEQTLRIMAQNNRFLDNFERLRRKNNMAFSFAYMTCAALNVVKGGQYLGSDTESMLIRQFNDLLANNPKFVTMNPMAKQFWYEQSIIAAGWCAFDATGQRGVQAQQRAWEDAQVCLRLVFGSETR